MPHNGDQHKTNGNTATNPYEEQKRQISVYTAQEIATLQSRLNKRLGPEFISTRAGPGNQKVAYLSAEKAINLANEVFGFNGWSSSIQQIDVDFVEENPQTGKVSLGLSVIVRVTLRDGTFHEDIGYGGMENCKGKASAFEKSKKEATTDALKRALRNFGNVLGNCIYDRNFVTQALKVKAEPTKFNVNDLHRPSEFTTKQETAPVAKQNVQLQQKPSHEMTDVSHTEFEDSFDMGEYDDVDFDEGDFGRPDEIVLPAVSSRSDMVTPSRPSHARPHMQQTTNGPQQSNNTPHRQSNQNGLAANQSSHDIISSNFTGQRPSEVGPLGMSAASEQHGARLSAGFYSARAAQNIDPNNVNPVPTNAARFDPRAESPSIRKTAGVDHSRSVPVTRDILKPDAAAPSRDVIDSKSDMVRRIGIPGQPGAGGLRGGPSTSSYRPPTRHASPAITGNITVTGKTGTEKPTTAAKRPPLADVSNGQHITTATTVDGADAKRQKVTGVANDGDVTVSTGIENG